MRLSNTSCTIAGILTESNGIYRMFPRLFNASQSDFKDPPRTAAMRKLIMIDTIDALCTAAVALFTDTDMELLLSIRGGISMKNDPVVAKLPSDSPGANLVNLASPRTLSVLNLYCGP